MFIARKGATGHLDPGGYKVKVERISEVDMPFGPVFKIGFRIMSSEREGQVFSELFPIQFTGGNKLGKLMVACGYDPSSLVEFDLSRLVDEMVTIEVKDKQTPKGTFSRIVGFKSEVVSYQNIHEEVDK